MPQVMVDYSIPMIRRQQQRERMSALVDQWANGDSQQR